MNIHGYKLKIKEIREELKKGRSNLGDRKFGILTTRNIMYNNLLKSLRKKRDLKKKKL